MPWKLYCPCLPWGQDPEGPESPPQLSSTVALACTTVRNDSVLKCDAGKSLQWDWFSLSVEKREARDFQCCVNDTDKLTGLLFLHDAKIWKYTKGPLWFFLRMSIWTPWFPLRASGLRLTHIHPHTSTQISSYFFHQSCTAPKAVWETGNKNHGRGHYNIVVINGTLQRHPQKLLT